MGKLLCSSGHACEKTFLISDTLVFPHFLATDSSWLSHDTYSSTSNILSYSSSRSIHPISISSPSSLFPAIHSAHWQQFRQRICRIVLPWDCSYSQEVPLNVLLAEVVVSVFDVSATSEVLVGLQKVVPTFAVRYQYWDRVDPQLVQELSSPCPHPLLPVSCGIIHAAPSSSLVIL